MKEEEMTKSKPVAVSAMALMCVAEGMANPLAFPTYTQTVNVNYRSAEEAESAEVSLAGLPGNAPVAFTTRWDDTNPAHLMKGEMLVKVGLKANFFLNYWGPHEDPFYADVAPQLRAMGHCFGNHTVNHPQVKDITEEAFFRQVVEQKVNIETKTGATVVSYAAPYGWPRELDDAHRALYVELLLASGHHTSQDGINVPRRGYTNVWYQTHIVWMNDRQPEREVYEKQLARAIEEVQSTNDVMPCITFGIHSWGDHDRVNAIQGTLLKETKEQHPDWYFGHANGYGAYRYQYFHGRVKKLGVTGTTAQFEITRFKPAQLGDTIGLSLLISGNPTAVQWAEQDLVSEKTGVWALPTPSEYAMPEGIYLVDEDGKTLEIPGLTFQLSYQANQNDLQLTVRNETASALEGLYWVATPSPAWAQRRLVKHREQLEAGATWSETVPLGGRAMAVPTEIANPLVVGSLDFVYQGRTLRLYRNVVCQGAFGVVAQP